jgi:hypothetical protein
VSYAASGFTCSIIAPEQLAAYRRDSREVRDAPGTVARDVPRGETDTSASGLLLLGTSPFPARERRVGLYGVVLRLRMLEILRPG